MDFLEKKKQINEYYDVIIKKIERQDGVKDICQCLLKLASFLNAFSSASIIEKDSILKKAIELLNAEKDFSKTCDYESLYKRLTGRELIKVKPKEIKEEDNKNEDDPIKKEESILEGYTFKWDNITNVSFDDVIGMEEVKDIIHIILGRRSYSLSYSLNLLPCGERPALPGKLLENLRIHESLIFFRLPSYPEDLFLRSVGNNKIIDCLS